MSGSPAEWFDDAQQVLFEAVVQPLMFRFDLSGVLEQGYEGTGWLLVGLLQLVVMLTLMRAFERWRPVEAVTDRPAVRTDIVYTLIHRLGVFRLLTFFAIDPLWDALAAEGRMLGLRPLDLDRLWPGITDIAIVSFLVYLVVFDFVDYWLHRAQHRFGWWWQLHALHHSQRQMTLWSDNRNHVLDDVLRDSLFALLALAIGVPPGQYVALVALTQLVESFSHANVRLDFGWLGSRLLVGPRFHRLHHGIGIGHESAGAGTLGGHNFAVLFPVWDLLFGTARYDGLDHPTGIRDQLPEAGARDYGRGFWAQQWLGMKRLVGKA
ncbi:sterol desaturase family protein [Aquincola sp. S2]|uniref:Sterol desaturase family protein n=1 Tax=Pseudaquabacterium terrae TaxID=2732868 RepID=A0ABX2EI67_9BURK|nr:sterol desaturase family protein [Aquabacterium terrae]NRF68308.1 sterol desaturase family protein [Aquabacterium terrae]